MVVPKSESWKTTFKQLVLRWGQQKHWFFTPWHTTAFFSDKDSQWKLIKSILQYTSTNHGLKALCIEQLSKSASLSLFLNPRNVTPSGVRTLKGEFRKVIKKNWAHLDMYSPNWGTSLGWQTFRSNGGRIVAGVSRSFEGRSSSSSRTYSPSQFQSLASPLNPS